MKFHNVWKLVKVLIPAFPYLLKSAWFNFHYLPFKKAIRFPILLGNCNNGHLFPYIEID